MLINDNYDWEDDLVLLGSLTQACKIQNDCLRCRLPIQKSLFEQLLFESERLFDQQFYLCCLYKLIFCLAYFGLMLISELVDGDHTVLASYIHIGTNKDKILVILYSSKTHSKANYPQKIKISANRVETELNKHFPTFFCPFAIIRMFLSLRGGYVESTEQFFIFKDRTSVKPSQVRSVLRTCLK